MASYKRQRILEAVEARLKQIKQADGFKSDVGEHVFHGLVNLGPDDPQLALGISPGTTETNENQAGKKIITLPIEIFVLARDDIAYPLFTIEAIIGDIKRALESDDLQLNGLARDVAAGEVGPLPRQEGSTVVGVVVEYKVTYTESWGDPEK